ncbi:MAG: hypothetical protein R3330_07235 [Saprospiraceae bacterium]|nr:hypothetical protein [Saprospiraceae bacterium]
MLNEISSTLNRNFLIVSTMEMAAKKSSGSQPFYMIRMEMALAEEFIPDSEFDVNGSVYFNCRTGGKNLLGVIVEVDKR